MQKESIRQNQFHEMSKEEKKIIKKSPLFYNATTIDPMKH